MNSYLEVCQTERGLPVTEPSLPCSGLVTLSCDMAPIAPRLVSWKICTWASAWALEDFATNRPTTQKH